MSTNRLECLKIEGLVVERKGARWGDERDTYFFIRSARGKGGRDGGGVIRKSEWDWGCVSRDKARVEKRAECVTRRARVELHCENGRGRGGLVLLWLRGCAQFLVMFRRLGGRARSGQDKACEWNNYGHAEGR